uniref:Tc1-like transposase DDE domain-containing protein n=1 Tax=Oryzias latipes TaxID=8090 RepID=A0A3P9KL99_ORYLA
MKILIDLVPHSHMTKTIFQEKRFTLLDPPACSPDLNAIENFWGHLWTSVPDSGCPSWSHLLETLAETCQYRFPRCSFSSLIVKSAP